MLDNFDHKPLIFVTGKGGVGKSTATAALASALAQRGSRVLVVETDTYSAMSEMLGAKDASNEPRKVSDNLWVANLQAKECLVNTLTRFLPSERIVRAVTANRVAEAFFQSAPSVSEFVLLDQIQLYLEQSGPDRFDHIVVDLPASGHAVTFLGVPQTLHDMMRGIGPIAKRANTIARQIENQRDTAIIAVCLPEEMPVNETIELGEQMRAQLHRGLDLALVNMIHRAPFEGAYRAAFVALRDRLSEGVNPAEILADEDTGSLVRLVAGNAVALDWYDRDLHYLGVLEAKLGTDVVEIPMIYEVDDAVLVERVADHLLAPDRPLDSDVLAS